MTSAARAPDYVFSRSSTRPEISVLNCFLALLTAFLLMNLVSWPMLMSFDLWVFKDRSSFLNLDYLLDKGFSLGVDTYYAYGLLPVLVQRALFSLFGRGFWPVVLCQLLYIVGTAWVWAALMGAMPQRGAWLVAVLLITPVILWVNPNLPYEFVTLSLLFAILFVLRGRNDIALAVNMVGWWSVPSLSIVAAELLIALILFAWWTGPRPRQISELGRQLLPGLLSFMGLGGLLVAVFGWASALATLLPLRGIEHYQAAHMGMSTLRMFLAPSAATWRYYIGNQATWFAFSSLAVLAVAIWAVTSALRHRRLSSRQAAVMLAAGLQWALILFAYGTPGQHVIFDPVLAAGVLVAIAMLPPGRVRLGILAGFTLLGLFSSLHKADLTLRTWREWKPRAETAGLWVPDKLASQWDRLVSIANSQPVLLLSYGTGVHHYFPSIQSAELWTLHVGQLFPADRKRLLDQIASAAIIAEDLSSPVTFIDGDPDIQAALSAMCLDEALPLLPVWRRPAPQTPAVDCLHASRTVPANLEDRMEFKTY